MWTRERNPKRKCTQEAQDLLKGALQGGSKLIDFHLKNSDWMEEIPNAPIFYPSKEEFKDPMKYIASIEAEASKFGICKIVPPVLPTTLPALVINPPGGGKFEFDTRQQWAHKQEWNTFNSEQFYQSVEKYTLAQYEKRADEVQRKSFGAAGSLPPRMVEEAYWCQYEQAESVMVEYGNDVEGTAFASPASRDPLASSPWNLQVMSKVHNSSLRSVENNIPGVTSPMLYVGMLFASFAWHVEDQYLYSINYQHMGAAKTWYGVPATSADGFENVAKTSIYKKAAKREAKKEGMTDAAVDDLVQKTLMRKTTVFSPKHLMDAGVAVCRVVQNPGEYVVTFPRSYHSGFSNGFCVGEAVNFGIGNWFKFGAQACERYRRLKQPIMLDQDRLLCVEAETLCGMDVEARQQHVSAPAGPLFVDLMLRLCKDVQSLADAGALNEGGHDPQAGLLCHSCGHSCYLAEVVVGEAGGLGVCLGCALERPPAELQGAKLACHHRLPQLQRVAHQLWQEGGGGGEGEASDVAALLTTDLKITAAARPSKRAASEPPCSASKGKRLKITLGGKAVASRSCSREKSAEPSHPSPRSVLEAASMSSPGSPGEADPAPAPTTEATAPPEQPTFEPKGSAVPVEHPGVLGRLLEAAGATDTTTAPAKPPPPKEEPAGCSSQPVVKVEGSEEKCLEGPLQEGAQAQASCPEGGGTVPASAPSKEADAAEPLPEVKVDTGSSPRGETQQESAPLPNVEDCAAASRPEAADPQSGACRASPKREEPTGVSASPQPTAPHPGNHADSSRPTLEAPTGDAPPPQAASSTPASLGEGPSPPPATSGHCRLGPQQAAHAAPPPLTSELPPHLGLQEEAPVVWGSGGGCMAIPGPCAPLAFGPGRPWPAGQMEDFGGMGSQGGFVNGTGSCGPGAWMGGGGGIMQMGMPFGITADPSLMAQDWSNFSAGWANPMACPMPYEIGSSGMKQGPWYPSSAACSPPLEMTPLDFRSMNQQWSGPGACGVELPDYRCTTQDISLRKQHPGGSLAANGHPPCQAMTMASYNGPVHGTDRRKHC